MVAISKILNNGLLLVPQSVYESLATPEQASVEGYNIINFLGGSAPYKQRTGYGISTEIPRECKLHQVQLFSRHGERYPSKGDGVQFEKIMDQFHLYKQPFQGDLAFLNEYKYFVEDPGNYEQETSTTNSAGIFAGTTDELRHGAVFRTKYGGLFDTDKVLPIFTTNSRRCHQTSEFFARGFLGDEYTGAKVKYVIIDEDGKMGANSLTPRYGCPNFKDDVNKDMVSKYDKSYLDNILARWVAQNPGSDFTPQYVGSLFLWCAFEINVKGHSPFCNLFTNEEYIRESYRNDLENYYSIGPGNDFAKVVGSPMLESVLKILKDEHAENKIWLSFTHDTDLELLLTSLGLLNEKGDLPIDEVLFPNSNSAAELLPQGARIYIEKYGCGEANYVRFIINEAVFPIPKCSAGPGFSCEFKTFISIIEERLKGINYHNQCGLDSESPSALTFYWDYNKVNYNATLINQ
ncbi:phosphoglycerate mutase-like protein [Suhomyces tanzawaensis NRRL Y-17324]|uniref:Phosphoglycerate mutase-like protein n=1 Tax=Suhomyces tanzawaensis NRRL Y-17324 TaxID=984487 RepID=A0A1E4SH77_9ASCO|nr:phosphoglycerate mutase-like protein [Suhomyces tanzawaensis NRRL Y-17324]ODV78863.1 phosphoglycerate mutase-like protein [Suhomyces tanzawaensis NRRL Y-17324]